MLLVLYSTTIAVNTQKKNGWESAGQFWNKFHADLLDGQLQQLWQAGCQHANEKRGGWAADVQHAGWQHRHEGVLPGEGVQQRQHCMATQRQHTAANREGGGGVGGETGQFIHNFFFPNTCWKWPTLSRFWQAVVYASKVSPYQHLWHELSQ